MSVKAPLPEADPQRVAEATELAARAPKPATSGNIQFGTAGWTDRTLIRGGLFYPKGMRNSRDRLAYYATQFPIVEVDATYYSILTADVAAQWVEWTPGEFQFDIKAFPVLTGHPIDTRRLPSDLKLAFERAGFGQRVYPKQLPPELVQELELRFRLFLAPLLEAGKLASVLLQFPPWFSATRGNVRHIEAVATRWRDIPFAVEFRHKSWLSSERRERVFDMLRACKLSYVCIDAPEVERSGVPGIVAVTNPRLAVVRFHGKNSASWQNKAATVQEKFNYLYSASELGPWVQSLKVLASGADQVHAVFNNCVRNYAVLNAKNLAVLFGDSRSAT